MFDHEGPTVVSAMRDLTRWLFDNLDITSPMGVDQWVAYTQRILIGAVLKKYKAFLLEFKQLKKDLSGDKWTLGEIKELYTEDLWTRVNSDGIYY